MECHIEKYYPSSEILSNLVVYLCDKCLQSFHHTPVKINPTTRKHMKISCHFKSKASKMEKYQHFNYRQEEWVRQHFYFTGEEKHLL